MAVDPRLSLGGQPLNIQQAIQGGLATAQQIRQAPIQEALLRQQQQAGSMQLQQTQQDLAQTQGVFLNRFANSLQALPLSQRASVVAQSVPMMRQMGIDPQQVAQADLTDQGLQQLMAQTQPFLQQAQRGNRFQFGASRVVEQDGKLFFATDKRDPQTGQIETVLSEVPGELADQLGRTTEERIGEEVEETRRVGEVEREQEVLTAQQLAGIQRKKARNQQLDENELRRINAAIDTGMAAAGNLPSVKRGLELLERVETGGLTARAAAVTDFFGTTSGDVGELRNILAQNVLAGLANFTGAISEGERQFLERMETNLSQGTEFNRRQLQRMQRIYEREVQKALDAAEVADDEFAIRSLRSALGQGREQQGQTQTRQGGQGQSNVIDWSDM